MRLLIPIKAAYLVSRAAAVTTMTLTSRRPLLHVTTYNVLSSHLASPDHFHACNPEHLNADYRYKSLLKKLDDSVEKRSVICLQEVSLLWAGKLHTYFSKRGYHLATALYGSRFNGYMGVTTAIPMDEYDIVDCDISVVADTSPFFRKPRPTLLSKILAYVIAPLKYLFSPLKQLALKLKLMAPEFDVWGDVNRRWNRMICVTLQVAA